MAEQLAEQYAAGELDEVAAAAKGSGKQRSKAEQTEHKHAHPEGDTRKIVTNILHGEEKRREEELRKTDKKDSNSK